MKNRVGLNLIVGVAFVLAFVVFTVLLLKIDVKPLGVNGTNIGFSSFNLRIHKLCGVNMSLYTITDWAGLVPIFAALSFAVFGLCQLIKRKSILKVDLDILALGVYYIIVAALYILFEGIPINYRPVLINGFMEVSYPSSTTLLVICVMPTVSEQICRRSKQKTVKITVRVSCVVFCAFMVAGRLLSGVHWVTDILGSVLISVGLFQIYKGFVLLFCKKEGKIWNSVKSFRL